VLASPLLADPVAQAVAYLEREVPRWRPENNCFSCHNNGDGARSLLLARAAGVTVKPEALRDSLEWLNRSADWDAKPLARVQFAAVLAVAGPADDRLKEAAELVAGHQLDDGHWQVDEESGPGSPVTYGPVLGTWMAIRVLRDAGAEAHRERIGRALDWIRARRTVHALDVAARVWALGEDAEIRRLLAMQGSSGSWNGEPFDTAIAMLALAAHQHAGPHMKRARDYLVSTQLEPGGWPGTTRPAGGPSYAQQISTSAWALMALLAVPQQTAANRPRW